MDNDLIWKKNVFYYWIAINPYQLRKRDNCLAKLAAHGVDDKFVIEWADYYYYSRKS